MEYDFEDELEMRGGMKNVTPEIELKSKEAIRARLVAESEDFYEDVKVGPAPDSNRKPLEKIPGSEEEEKNPVGSDLQVIESNPFFTSSFRKTVLEAGLELLRSPSHKVRAMVFHDLLEAQGLINRRGPGRPGGGGTDFGDEPSEPQATKTIKMLFGDPTSAAKILDAMRELSGGKAREVPK